MSQGTLSLAGRLRHVGSRLQVDSGGDETMVGRRHACWHMDAVAGRVDIRGHGIVDQQSVDEQPATGVDVLVHHGQDWLAGV